LNIDIQVRPLGGPALVQQYLAGAPEAAAFFRGDPFDPSAYRSRQEEVLATFARNRREKAAAALRPTSPAAHARLARFVEQGGAVVTTGQQAGLFGGPLFTVLKALTAVRLAETLEATLGIVVLPVFWIASEDHDWAEVNHAYLVDRGSKLHRVEARSEDPNPLPMHVRTFDESLESTLSDLEQVLSGYRYSRDVVRSIRTHYRPDSTVAAAFGSLVTELLAPFDVLTVDAADPALKQASEPVLRRALTDAAAHEAGLQTTAEQLATEGFGVQVPVLPSAANLFLQTAHGRERLYRDGRGGWLTHESGERHTLTELEERLVAEPGVFSPNVLLRPVVESHVFPVLAYVAGPGEMAYFGQLRSLFEAQGVGMPLVYPRASMVLQEPRVTDALARLGLSEADLHRPRHELIRRRSREAMPARVVEGLRELRQSVVDRFDDVADEAAAIDPMLASAIGARRNRALLEVADAEQKILRAVTRKEEEWARRLDGVAAHLLPLGQPQERVLNALPFLAEHGASLLQEIAARIPTPLREEKRSVATAGAAQRDH